MYIVKYYNVSTGAIKFASNVGISPKKKGCYKLKNKTDWI